MSDEDFEIIAKEIIYMALADGQPAMTLPGALRELRALAYDVREEALEECVAIAEAVYQKAYKSKGHSHEADAQNYGAECAAEEIRDAIQAKRGETA